MGTTTGIEDARVAKDYVGRVEVSTVRLPYAIGESSFETMIFGGPYDQEQWRYSTRDEALKGHAAAVALVRDENMPGGAA